MGKIKAIKQMSETECGLCCVVMVLRYYGNHETLGKIQEQLEIGRDGVNIKQLYDFLKQKGFDVKILRGGDSNSINSVKLPCIAFFDEKHYVVIGKVKRKYIEIFDPAYGRRKLNYETFDKRYSNYILEFLPNKEFKKINRLNDWMWMRVLKCLLDNKIKVVSLMLSMALSYLFYLLIPIFTQNIIDEVAKINNVGFLKLAYIVLLLGLGFLSVNIIRAIVAMFLNVALGTFLEGWSFKKLMSLPYKYFDIRSSGDLLYRLVSSNGVKELLTTQIVAGIVDFGAIIVISFYMMQKALFLFLACGGIAFLCFLIMLLIRPYMTSSMDEELVERSKVQEKEVEALATIMSIKMSSVEDRVCEAWDNAYLKLIKKFKKRVIIHDIYNGIIQSVQLFAPLIILILCLYLYYVGRLTIGEAIAFETISSTFFGLVTSVANSYTQYIVASSYLDRISEIWERKSEEKNIGAKVDISGNISVENVSFSYAKCSPQVLNNVSLKIKKNTKVAIVGKSGSGKSTLGKLLCGLYEPTNGKIFYDDKSITEINKKYVGEFFGIVPQDVTLFNTSIYDNIVMNREGVTKEKVYEACKIACIYDEIISMPMGFKTMVSEMGKNLSGGQKQRILLARIIINTPRILVLDEATSSLDTINERNISEYLKKNGCTRIIIAHRLSTVIDADVIYVVDNGCIVAKGKHQDLLSDCELYSELYNSNFS